MENEINKVSIVEDITEPLQDCLKKRLKGILVGIVQHTKVVVTGFLTFETYDDIKLLSSFTPGGVGFCGTFSEDEASPLLDEEHHLHISLASNGALMAVLNNSFVIDMKIVESDLTVFSLSRDFALFQIRGQITVNLQAKNDRLEFDYEHAMSNETLFLLAAENLLLIPSQVRDRVVNDLLPRRKDENSITGPHTFERTVHCVQVNMFSSISSGRAKSPFIKLEPLETGMRALPVFINALCLASVNMPLIGLPKLLLATIVDQLYLMKKVFVDKFHASSMKLPVPEFHHYFLRGWCHPITVCYPANRTDDQLQSFRQQVLHETFFLPTTRPYFRRMQGCYVYPPTFFNPAVISPHIKVKPPKMQHGKVFLVDGLYSYHHYMQDDVDDNGWGCSYRALQTLISWFRFKGFTNKPIPTHVAIQQLAVKIGERQEEFVGTAEWLGAFEIGGILTEYVGFPTKIINVERGSDLGTVGRQLCKHFETEGTPIMIGGGVFAHVILGVCFSAVTGETKFLVLDPHYIGPDRIDRIIGRGFCAWKSIKFWNQTAFYNLCLPTRPSGC